MRWGELASDGPAAASTALWYGLVLAGAVVAGFAIVAVRRLTATDSAPSIFMSQSLVGFWVAFVPALARPAAFGPRLALILLAIGLVAAAAQLLMTWSYGRVDIATGSLLSMLAPVINVGIGDPRIPRALRPGGGRRRGDRTRRVHRGNGAEPQGRVRTADGAGFRYSFFGLQRLFGLAALRPQLRQTHRASFTSFL